MSAIINWLTRVLKWYQSNKHFQRFTNEMATRINWHRYRTTLRHRHPMYVAVESSGQNEKIWKKSDSSYVRSFWQTLRRLPNVSFSRVWWTDRRTDSRTYLLRHNATVFASSVPCSRTATQAASIKQTEVNNTTRRQAVLFWFLPGVPMPDYNRNLGDYKRPAGGRI